MQNKSKSFLDVERSAPARVKRGTLHFYDRFMRLATMSYGFLTLVRRRLVSHYRFLPRYPRKCANRNKGSTQRKAFNARFSHCPRRYYDCSR